MKKESEQIVDGKWYNIFDYDEDICCDCGLRHKIKYRLHPVTWNIQFMVRRLNKGKVKPE